MTEETQPWYADVVMSPLLAAARATYVRAIRQGLAETGLEDLPRRGPFILGAMANHGSTFSEATAGLKITRQAASQLLDSMVLRGYLERDADPDDRRRVTVSLTERGRAAAQVTREAIADIDAALESTVGPEAIATTRAVLAAMVDLGHTPED